MKNTALIILNPKAGSEKGLEYEDRIREVLSKQYSNIIVEYTKGEGDATRFAKKTGEAKVDLVVSLGGDGTVHEVVNGLAGLENPPTLGIIPMGTVNDLARSLNIPIQPIKAIELLVNGVEHKIDLGLVNSRYFTNVLGVGNAARAIHNVDSKEKTKIGPLAYIKALAKEVLEDEIFEVKIEMDDSVWKGNVSVIIVGLIESFGGMKTIFSDVEVGDGKFFILAVKRLNVPQIMNMAPSLILGNITKSDNIKYFKSKKIKITTNSGDKQECDLDGEKGPNLPLEIKILPKHLSVISNKT